jgi:hypothetical protein
MMILPIMMNVEKNSFCKHNCNVTSNVSSQRGALTGEDLKVVWAEFSTLGLVVCPCEQVSL